MPVVSCARGAFCFRSASDHWRKVLSKQVARTLAPSAVTRRAQTPGQSPASAPTSRPSATDHTLIGAFDVSIVEVTSVRPSGVNAIAVTAPSCARPREAAAALASGDAASAARSIARQPSRTASG
jgi:hypothetical protein